jgi:hypothetical protein
MENAKENGHETVRNGKSERSNTLERIVENGYGTVTLTHQKRKNYCTILFATRLSLGGHLLTLTTYDDPLKEISVGHRKQSAILKCKVMNHVKVINVSVQRTFTLRISHFLFNLRK